MGSATVPAAGGGIATLQQTITAAGAVSTPAGQSLIYAAIGSSPTAIQAAGWVLADTSYALVGGYYYYSFLMGTGPNLYLYY